MNQDFTKTEGEIEENELEEAGAEFFEFKQLSKNVARLRLSEDIFDEKSIPPYSSLLAISNLYGYFVAGTSKGFIYAFTKELREAFNSSVAKPEEQFKKGIHVDIPEGRIHFLRLTLDQLTIIVGVEGGQVLCYDVTKLSTESSEIRPFQIIKFSGDIMDIRPNPGERNNLIAFLVSGVVYIKDFISNEEIGLIQSSKVGEQITAICWSQKGEQLVCGSQSGRLTQYTPEGIIKDAYQTPPTIQQRAYSVRSILWLETAIFIVTYYPVVRDETSEHEVFMISREKDDKSKAGTIYSRVDICLSSPREKSSYMFMESIRDWDLDLKTGVICACTSSSDTNLIARNAASNEWAIFDLAETARANLPISKHHQYDTLPIGMALDLSSTEDWVTKLTGDEDSKIPPVPILFIYNDESEIVAFRCFQKNAYSAGKSCPGMTVPIPIPTTSPSTLKNITGPSMLKNTTDSSALKNITGPSMLKNTTDSSTLKNTTDSSTLKNTTDSSTLKNITGPSMLKNTTDSSTLKNIAGPSMLKNTTDSSTLKNITGPSTLNNDTTGPISMLNNTTGPISMLNNITGPSILKNIETTTIGATLDSVNKAPVSTYTPNIPKNNVPPLERSNNNLKNNIAVGPNAQNAPLRNQVKQSSPTGPHAIRLNETRKSVQEIQLIIDEIEKRYLIKYHERTKADSLENPDEWSIGDLPVIISETKRLEKEIKNIIESLSILKQETTDLDHNFMKEDAMTKQEIGLLVSPQKVPPARRGTIQLRITEKYEKAFKDVKENADALEKQLDMLHEQIKDHKANKFAGRPPLEYIDRSIRNISIGLNSNVSQIEKLNTQLDLISEQLASLSFKENGDDFVSRQIEHETRKSTIPVKYSGEADERTKQTMKKEWKLFKLLNVNKSKRKNPCGTNLFSDIEPVQSYMSPKVISPRKSQSPIKTRGSIGIDKLKELDKNKHSNSNSLRSNFDEESDHNELYTPTKRNTYTGFGLPTSEDMDEVSPKYSKQISEIRERRLRYFEKEKDVTENAYLDNTSIYEPTVLRETRVRFQEPSETRVYDDDGDDDDDDDEFTEDSIQKKFENTGSDLLSRIRLINKDTDRLSISQNNPFENNFYEPSKFSDIDNNYSDYVSSPESPKEEVLSYSLSNEQKDTVTSEESSTQDSLDSFEDKFDKIIATEISNLSKVSELQYYDGESKSDLISSEAIEEPAELEKKEEIIEQAKEEKVESNSFGEVPQEPSEIKVESKVEEVLQQPLTTGERAVTGESTNVTTGLGSFGQSSFGATHSIFGRGTFNVGNGVIPPAFATPPQPPPALNQTQSQPTPGQSFGLSSQIPNPFPQQPAFGTTGFGQAPIGQATFGRVGLGQPQFGQSGFGTQLNPITPALNASGGVGFARFASNSKPTGFGISGSSNASITPTTTSSTSSNPLWSQFRD